MPSDDWFDVCGGAEMAVRLSMGDEGVVAGFGAL
jgi:hypothetical protein